MRGPRSLRLVILLLLSVCLGLAGSAVRPSHLYSQSTAPADFARNASGLIAHGKRAEAEQLARSRGEGDPAAAAVLAQLASARGQYADARALLEPVASHQPESEAALELAIVDLTVGKGAEANALLDHLSDPGTPPINPGCFARRGPPICSDEDGMQTRCTARRNARARIRFSSRCHGASCSSTSTTPRRR